MYALFSGNISAGTLPAAEGVTQAIPVQSPVPEGRIRIRGHLLVTGNASAGTITIRIRQGTTTGGTQVYTTGALTAAVSAALSIPFEFEDDTNWINGAGQYVITSVDSAGAGTVNGGYVAVEVIP